MSEQGKQIDTDLVDPVRLAAWMDTQGLGQGAICDMQSVTGGTQNVLVRFKRSGREFILRRPPISPRPGNDETMRREARVLAAIKQSDTPHPRLIAACSQTNVLGVAFYLMEPVQGFGPISGLPPLHAGSAEIRRRMGFSLIEGIEALHRIDYQAVGLDGFGKPVGYLARQVSRWQKQLGSYAEHENWPGPASIPGLQEVADWLSSNMPIGSAAGIVHGDYQFANVMYQYDSGELAAIVDWELASIGDPLIDVGWVAATWQSADGPELPVLRIEPWDGFPSVDEIINHYARLSPRDLSHIEWYIVLACYRLGILLEGTFARACSGKAPMQTGQLLHEATVALFGRALLRIRRRTVI